MKSVLIWALLLSPALAQPAHWTAERGLALPRVSQLRISPDGAHVAYVVQRAHMEEEKSEWRGQIHLDGRPFTSAQSDASVPAWSPDGKWLAFASDRGGQKGVYKIPLTGGEATLVSEQKGAIQDLCWSPDGTQLAMVALDPPNPEDDKARREKRDVRVVDEHPIQSNLYVMSASGQDEGTTRGKALQLTRYLAVQKGVAWVHDGTALLFCSASSPQLEHFRTSDISLVDVDTQHVRPLVTGPGPEWQPLLSPDGSQVAFTRSPAPYRWANSGRTCVIALGGGPVRELAETPDAQPELLAWAPDGRSLLFAEAQGTVARVGRLPTDGSPPRWLGDDDRMVEQPSLSQTGKLAYLSEAPDRPPEVFTSDLHAWPGRQVSQLAAPDLPPVGKTELMRWSSGGRSLEGLLSYPLHYRAGQRYPLVLVIHGGPTGVFQRVYLGQPYPYNYAAMTESDYFVLRPNIRGSSGYGQDFRFANYGDWGGADYRDLMDGVDHAIARGLADPDRLAVMGWSYGGYMTAWVETQTSRFRCAALGGAAIDLISFTGTADVPGFLPDYFGNLWQKTDAWLAHSPLMKAESVRTPTLIVHGEADPRVPIGQSYEFYHALKQREVPVKMVVYPRQAHALAEPKMQLDCARRHLEWLDQWLGEAARGK